MQVYITAEERQALLGWKKRSDSPILIRLKSEATLYASHGVDLDFTSRRWWVEPSGRLKIGCLRGVPAGCTQHGSEVERELPTYKHAV